MSKINHRRVYVVALIFSLVAIITAVVFIQARARPNLLSEMQTRLESKGVQVNYIKVLSEEPYSLEIGLQSQSQDDNMLPEDALQLMLTSQEATLCYRTGLWQDSISVTVKLVNTQGDIISEGIEGTDFMYKELLVEQLSLIDEPERSDAEMEAYAREQLELDQLPGLEVKELSVTTIEVADTKRQMLLVRVSAEDLSPANPSIQRLYDNFTQLASPFIEDNRPFIMGQLQYLSAEGKVALNRVMGIAAGEKIAGAETGGLGWLFSFYHPGPHVIRPEEVVEPTPVAYP